jgi:hypothetical protein
MMEINSVFADSQTMVLDEYVQVSRRIRKAGRGAHVSPPTDRKNSSASNSSANFATLEPRTVPTKTIPTTPGAKIGKEGGNAGLNQAPSIAPQERPELQQKGKETKAL